MSLSLEPTFYTFKMTPYSFSEFPITAKITTVEVGAIQTLSFKIGKVVFLDFKLIPNFLLADYDTVEHGDPAIAPPLRSGTRNYSLPELDLSGSIVLRAMVQEVKVWRKDK